MSEESVPSVTMEFDFAADRSALVDRHENDGERMMVECTLGILEGLLMSLKAGLLKEVHGADVVGFSQGHMQQIMNRNIFKALLRRDASSLRDAPPVEAALPLTFLDAHVALLQEAKGEGYTDEEEFRLDLIKTAYSDSEVNYWFVTNGDVVDTLCRELFRTYRDDSSRVIGDDGGMILQLIYRPPTPEQEARAVAHYDQVHAGLVEGRYM